MKHIIFNNDWKYKNKNAQKYQSVSLPHDAMILEERSKKNKGGKNTAWFAGGDYEYIKEFYFDKTLISKKIILEFEGIYKDSKIFVNNQLIYERPYGYIGFHIDISKYIIFGEKNTIKVEVYNNDQPNSRWYTGSGIYRPVNLYILPKDHIAFNSIRVKTVDYKNRVINVQLKTTKSGIVRLDVYDNQKNLISVNEKIEGSLDLNIAIPEAKLWNLREPNLYQLKATFENDEQIVTFGIREVKVDTKDGFQINRKRVILKGACVHHDNGLIGATGHPYADKRKARIIKKQGFNAVRSAHNPISKAFLEECDKIGLLVLDEYVDMWYIHKTKYDYASKIMDWWKEDLQAIVDKDYNHPSVIMYSIGNEVSETSEKKGIEFAKTMTDFLHTIDERPVTCGVNIFFNYLYSLGLGVYTDKKADKALKDPGKAKPVGSEFFNELAGKLGDKTMKFGAWLPGSDRKTKDAFAHLDVAGYNYGITRYKKDVKKYPDRIILGTETFCKDANVFMELAKKNPSIIGDFVWSGMDYLGEIGVGSWVSQEITKDYTYGPGWMSAGSGRIDLLGNPLSEMNYMRVAYEIDQIRIGVVPVNEYGKKHSPSAWKMTNSIESWSFSGYENQKTLVEVYTKEKYAALKLNGNMIGKKKTSKNGYATFKVKYQPGLLEAIGLDEKGNECCSTSLKSASSETIMNANLENFSTTTNDLIYINYSFSDESGEVKPLVNEEIKLQVEGGQLLAFGNACPYHKNKYQTNSNETYYGVALAIIRPTDLGKVVVSASSKYGSKTTEIEVFNNVKSC